MRIGIVAAAAGVLWSIASAAQASPPPAEPSDIVVVSTDTRKSDREPLSPLPSFSKGAKFSGVALPTNDAGKRRIQVNLEHFPTPYPICEPGMILPLCGGIARVESAGRDVRFRMLADDDLPAGIERPGGDIPLILAAPRLNENWGETVDRIGVDDSGQLTADLTCVWTQQLPEQGSAVRRFRFLNVAPGSVIGHPDYLHYRQVAQIVPPNPPEHVVGWITLRQIPQQWQPGANPELAYVMPDTIVVLPEVSVRGLPPDINHLPTPRRKLEFTGKTIGNEVEIHQRSSLGSWGNRSPPCVVGMLLPVCGKVGQVASVEPRGSQEEVVFKMLTAAQLPAGIIAPGDEFPLVLGGFAGNVHVSIRPTRIGVDKSGTLSVDLKQFWTVPAGKNRRTAASEALSDLQVGSTFTFRWEPSPSDYRITHIVAPDEKHQVPGWITVRPVPVEPMP